MRKPLVIVVAVLGVFTVMVLAAYSWYRHQYPFGSSHCCISVMMLDLQIYAKDHEGRYPAGEATPEASLSLLYKSAITSPYTLRGMTVPEAITRQVLESGKLLSAESCGWQYVPGLTQNDDTRLALLWCKEALGHNGQRTKDGGRQVVYVYGGIEWVSGAKWAAFLEEQKQLLQKRSDRIQAGESLKSG